jgi:hypothetical protein
MTKEDTMSTVTDEVVDTDSVVKTTDVNPPKVPSSFRDLKRADLLNAARYFGTETEGGVEVLRTDLHDSGVTWEDYVKAFKLPGHEDIPDAPYVGPSQVDVEDWEDAPELEKAVSEVIITAPPVDLAPAERYLVKFIGENPYFETGRFKFTIENPYAVMTAEEAQDVLVAEPTKFRQAFPDELKEFFDEQDSKPKRRVLRRG